MRFFNTAGPINPADHYALPPLSRWNIEEIEVLLGQKKYFVLHAPRQTGKTSCLLALMEYLNKGHGYRCLYANVEAGQAARGDVEKGVHAILNEIVNRARTHLGWTMPAGTPLNILRQAGGHAGLNHLLGILAEQAAPLPLVLLIDEIDSLVGDTLISVLRQIRSGYDKRPAGFPGSIILCGVRDVRDYRLRQGDGEVITGGSAFNIKAKSLRLANFDQPEVEALLAQHTAESGQVFRPEAVDKIWYLSQGQPWLVNALAYEVTFEIKAGRDLTRSITVELVDDAKENLIQRRETHLDQLADKLKEERVRRVIGPILASGDLPQETPRDDIEYAMDLGLVVRSGQGYGIANPIYREVLPRELIFITDINLSATVDPAWYIQADGRLDMQKLLTGFQAFFRENSESWIECFDYKEAGPQLLLQAYLQRVVNGGGRIEREYGLGRMRTDLFVLWPHPGGVQKIVVELKILRKSPEKTLAAGLKQTWEYMDRCAADHGHLVIFDRALDRSWEEKCYRREETWKDRTITVWGM